MASETTATGPALDPEIAVLSGETLVELLERATSRTPESVAMVIRRGMADERWTYRQLSERVARIAQNLHRAGVGPGDRVLTWSQNDPWLVAAYFAVWRAGAIIVPLDLRMQTDVAIRIGTRAEPTLLLAGQDVDPDAAAALGVPVLSVDQAGLDPGSQEPERPCATVTSGDVAEVIFTSGTTSDPKGVVLTHGQVVHSARAITQTGRGTRPDRALAIVSMSHMYGQVVPLLAGFMTGSMLVFLQALTPKIINSTMQRERITAVTLAPQVISILLQSVESEARRSGQEARLRRARRISRWLPFPLRRLLFRSLLERLGGALEVISSGGAMLSPELQQAWELFGVRIVQGYGTTEAAVVCGHLRSRQRKGTVGPPLAGIEVCIAPDSELLVRGPNVMRGYWRAPEATAEVLDPEGWLHTGDAARMDDSGELVILGRTRDRISLPSGLNVYPEDVEAALVDTGAVRAAVVLEPTPGRLAAVIVPRDPGSDQAELDAAVKQANATLAPHQRLGTWRRWPEDDFPRTHTLKVRPAPVKAWYAQAEEAEEADGGSAGSATGGSSSVPTGSLTVSSPHAVGQSRTPAPDEVPLDAVAGIVSAVVADARGVQVPGISGSTTLSSLELDSLSVVTLALRLDEAFDAPLSDNDIVGAIDIAVLHALVVLRRGQPPAPPPSRWAFSAPARSLRRLLDVIFTGPALHIVTRLEVEGNEHLQALPGPVLVCPNHTSHLDAPVVRAALPSPMRDRSAIAAAADVWFDGSPWGPVTELLLGAIPFGRSSDIRASLERVADLVNAGYSVIIFPEGTRSADGRLGQMREGIGLLATNLGIPVVPTYIAGAHQILPKGSWLPRRRGASRVRVRFGAAMEFDPGLGIKESTAQVGRAIESLGQATSRR